MLPLFDFPVALVVKNPPAKAGDNRCLGREDPLEKGMATHSSVLAWRIPWTEEPDYSPWIAKSWTQRSPSPASLGNFLSLQVLA